MIDTKIDPINKKIDFKKIIHYVFIFLMFFIPASALYTYALNTTAYMLICGVLIIPMLFEKKYRSPYVFALLILFSMCVVFTRLINGGVGISSLIDYFNCILVVNLAFNFDKDQFFKRFCHATIIVVVISFVGYFLSLTNLYKFLPFIKVSHVNVFEGDSVSTRGLFFYTFSNAHLYRNTSFFTEPGKYQILLNSALFILVFFGNITFKKNKKILYIILLLIAILTTMSTTGYIGALFIILMHLFVKRKDNSIKRIIIPICLVGLLYLSIEYSINGENSLLYKTILEKLFVNGQLDLEANTGAARLGTIELSLNIISKNFFGVGYNQYNLLNQGTYNAGGVYMSFMAVFGFPAWLFFTIIFFAPIIKSKKLKAIEKVVFIFLFLNTGLSQTHLIYPCLLIFPVYFYSLEGKYQYLVYENVSNHSFF